MNKFDTEADQQIANWVRGYEARPAQRWSLHIPFYYPKDGGRISPDLLTTVLEELEPLAREFISIRVPVGIGRDEETGETYQNTVLAVQTLIRDPGAGQLIPEWAERNGQLLKQERELFTYHQPVWVVTKASSGE